MATGFSFSRFSFQLQIADLLDVEYPNSRTFWTKFCNISPGCFSPDDTIFCEDLRSTFAGPHIFEKSHFLSDMRKFVFHDFQTTIAMANVTKVAKRTLESSLSDSSVSVSTVPREVPVLGGRRFFFGDTLTSVSPFEELEKVFLFDRFPLRSVEVPKPCRKIFFWEPTFFAKFHYPPGEFPRGTNAQLFENFFPGCFSPDDNTFTRQFLFFSPPGCPKFPAGCASFYSFPLRDVQNSPQDERFQNFSRDDLPRMTICTTVLFMIDIRQDAVYSTLLSFLKSS